MDVHAARQFFLLTGKAAPDGVRPEIARSWERSRRSGADPERLPVPYEPDCVDPGSRLVEAARPVMEHYADVLSGTMTCLVLADREARGIATWVGERTLEGALDRLGARPGFRFSEDVAGTNGLGTPIETGEPISISVGEHYAEALQPLSCAGVPVRHPLTRHLLGVVDITCAGEDRHRLLLPLANEIAKSIEDRLYADASEHERLLLRHFMTASRGAATRGVVVVSPDMVLANPLAARLLEGVPQALLWEQASQAMTARSEARRELPAAQGGALVVRCVPVSDGDRVIGATLELVRPADGGSSEARKRGTDDGLHRLPGLAGRSVAWRRMCREALHAGGFVAGPVVVAGERGVGKRAVARAVLQARDWPEPLVVDAALEAADGVRSWHRQFRKAAEDPAGRPVLLTHLECLSPAAVRALCATGDAGGWPAVMVATLTTSDQPLGHCAPLLDRLGAVRVEVPALRSRPEDIPDLVAAFLGGRVCRPEALQALTRSPWPGNTRQLEGVLRAIAARRNFGDIRLEDLPDEVRRQSGRRALTPMEQAELDAMLAALDRAGGNKAQAAAALGISRSTLYSKLRAFGVKLDRNVV